MKIQKILTFKSLKKLIIHLYNLQSTLHFFIIVFNMLRTLSARKGKDQENTFKLSGSL